MALRAASSVANRAVAQALKGESSVLHPLPACLSCCQRVRAAARFSMQARCAHAR
jgi:hypothetical protein